MDDEVDLLEYWNILLRSKKFICFFVAIFTCLAVVISLFLPKYYKSEAVLLPQGMNNSGGSMASMLFSVPLGLDGLSTSSSKNKLLSIMNSRTLIERVIREYQILPSLYSDDWNEIKKQWASSDEQAAILLEHSVVLLRSILDISDDKKAQTIHVKALTKNPQFSADLVNNFILSLQKLLKENTYTESKRNRIFIEGQLQKVRVEYLRYGKEIVNYYSEKHISDTMPFASVDVSEDFPKDSPFENTEKQNIKEESFGIEGAIKKNYDLQLQLDALNDLQIPSVVGEVPQQVYFQYLLAKQKQLEQLIFMLSQKYEIAKIDEAKEDVNFQVVDWARTPTKKDSPKRGIIVIVTFFMSLFLSVLLVFCREYFNKIRSSLVNS